MPSPVDPILQLVSGVLETITPFTLGKSARVELLRALTPIAELLKDALAQVPFAIHGRDLRALGAEVEKLADLAAQLHSKLHVPQRNELQNVEHLLKGFLMNASTAGYSEAYAVLSQVRRLQDELR